MDKDKFARELFEFYACDFYYERTPLEIYNDEKLNVKCAITGDRDRSDVVSLISLGLSLVHKDAPVEVLITFFKSILKDKEGMKLIKEFSRELMEKEYELECFNGSISYPFNTVIYPLGEEFEKHFGKVGYALAIRNGGDPVFIEDDGEKRVAFILSPIFISREQMNELEEYLKEEDEDSAFDYLFNTLDLEGDCSTLK